MYQFVPASRLYDAERRERVAYDWGLVNRVVESGDAVESAVEMAETIAEFPQQTVRTDRQAVYDGVGEPLEKGLKIEAWHGRRSLDTALEGAELFAEEH